jgi:DNA-binding CsgD family transcriptional regulator/DNA replicative helicase MCM subunit Mcm2 (Cdc46/Mcm family)
VVVGREGELAALAGLIAASGAGHGGAMFLSGEPGIGKSALLRSAVEIAQDAGVESLIGRSVAGLSPVPLRPLAEALLSRLRRETLPVDDHLAPFRPALARLTPQLGTADVDRPETSPVFLGEGLLRLLRLLCPSGCLLVLDDLQWADPETLEVVEFLCDNVSGEPIAVLGTTRDVGQPGVIERLRSRGSATVVQLEPLSAPVVAAMIKACPVPDGVSDEVAAEVAAAADGIPLLVEEVLSLAADPKRVAGARVPATVAEIVRLRLVELDRDARRVLLCAALLGRRFDWRLVASATGLGEPTVSAALGHAIELQLLESDGGAFRFRHALTRDAVRDSALVSEVGSLAAATRAAVESAHPGLPEEWCTIAANLAELAGDRDGAAALLVVAGGRALRQAALGTAELLLGRALNLTTSADAAAEAAELLVDVLAAEGRVDDAVEVAGSRLAYEGRDPSRRVRLQLLLARAAIAGERWTLAAEQLDALPLVAEGISGFTAEAAALRAQVAFAAGHLEEAVALATTAVSIAETNGRPEVGCEALEVIGRVERLHSTSEARTAFERSAALAEANGLAFWRLRAIHELGTVDMFETGRLDRLLEARSLALEAGALGVAAVLDVQLAGGLWVRGDATECVAAGRRAAEAGRRFHIDGVRRIGLCFAAMGHGPLIDPVGLAAAADALAAEGSDPELDAAVWGDGWAVYALLTEDRRGAIRSIEIAAELAGFRAAPLPSPWWGLWPLLRALEGRDATQALAAARRVAPSGWNTMMLGYANAVISGQEGDRVRAEASFVGVDDPSVPWQWWRHLGRRLVAESALGDGWGEPTRWLAEAASFFDGFPAPATASACRSLLRRAGVAPTRVRTPSHVAPALATKGVTEREAEVLGLIGLGLSNRDVAERLFLSPRTVEKHVENLARKLGTSTRSQMVAFAAGTNRAT